MTVSNIGLPKCVELECDRGGPGEYYAMIWERGRTTCLAFEAGTTRLSAIQSAVETYFVGRIASAQLLSEALQ